jgi:hypothetical protein
MLTSKGMLVSEPKEQVDSNCYFNFASMGKAITSKYVNKIIPMFVCVCVCVCVCNDISVDYCLSVYIELSSINFN